MLTKETRERLKTAQIVSVEDLVPPEHILRKIDRYISFEFIYELVEPLYSTETGRPSIDPIILFKMVLLQHFYGLGSMRRTVREIETNMAYRWFLGLDLFDAVPHFGTFSKNYKRRFEGTPLFEQIFSRILEQCMMHGFVDCEVLFVDATHVKANANRNQKIKKQARREVLEVERRLRREINQEREAHDKPPFDDDQEPPRKEETKSPNDDDCGMFHKGEHKREFAYSVQTSCDVHGWVVGYSVHPGNHHDSRTFYALYDKLKPFHPKKIVMDAGYKVPMLMEYLLEEGVEPILPYTRPKGNSNGFTTKDFVYDEMFDCVLCPHDQILTYSTTNRQGYHIFKSDPHICVHCTDLARCTKSRDHQKIHQVHIYHEAMERCKDLEHGIENRILYKLRKHTIERCFAFAKEQHGMRYTRMNGRKAMEMKAALTFTCLNIKKLVRMLEYRDKITLNSSSFLTVLRQKIKNVLPYQKRPTMQAA